MINLTVEFFMSKGEHLIWLLNATTQSEFCISPFDLFSGFRTKSAKKPCLRFVSEKLQNIFEKGLKNVGVVAH